jgi:DNA-binding NarL/FixJ family response regulator
MARAKQKTSGRRTAVSKSARGAGTRGRSAKKTGRARAGNDRQDRWSAQEDRQLRTMVKQGHSIRDVVSELGRSESAVRQHVYKLGLALRGRKRRA